MTKPILEPKDQAEALALFRSEIVGALVRRELDHGDLKAAFQELSRQRFRPPRSRARVALRSTRWRALSTPSGSGAAHRRDRAPAANFPIPAASCRFASATTAACILNYVRTGDRETLR
jgi:hypothetical protein